MEVVTRRTQYRIDKAREREHIVEGLVRALDMIDAIIELIRGAADVDEARAGLMAKPFEFSEIHANHILVDGCVVNPLPYFSRWRRKSMR